MSSLIAGTDYVELPGSPRMTVDRSNGLTGKRMFRVDWNKGIDFVAEMIGGWTVIAGIVVRQYATPFPGYPFLLATTADIDPMVPEAVTGGDLLTLSVGAADYDYAKVVVQYRVPDPGPDDDATNDIVMSTPGRSWLWSDDKKVSTDVNPGIVIPTVVHRLSWSNIPDSLVPWEDIRDKMGTINTSKYLGAAAKRLLFTGSNASRMWDLQALAAGEYQQAWRLDYTFDEQMKPDGAGWNHFWRQEQIVGKNWVLIKTDPDGDPPYADSSFKSLTEFRT